MKDNNDLRYPIGKFTMPSTVSNQQVSEWIEVISLFPSKLADLTENLTNRELEFQYRHGGWNIRQIIHHCADSHMNSYFRFKLGLTEDLPSIKPYREDLWAELADLRDVSPSIRILEGLHLRWEHLLQSLTPQQLELQYFHPEANKSFSLKETIGLYAWHSNHHLAHIMLALETGN